MKRDPGKRGGMTDIEAHVLAILRADLDARLDAAGTSLVFTDITGRRVDPVTLHPINTGGTAHD